MAAGLTFDDLIPKGAAAEPAAEAPDLSFDDLIPKKGASSTAMDMAKSAGVGLGEGVIGLASLPFDASQLAIKGGAHAGNWIRQKLGMEAIPEEQMKQFDKPHPLGSAAHKKRIEENVTGPFYEPQTTAGEYARTAGQFAPGVVGPGGLVRNVIATGAAALGSEAAGQAAKGTAMEPYARAAGGVAGGIGPSIARRAVTPFPASAERTAAVNTLRKEGVTGITAGQSTGSKGLQYFESEMGGGAAASKIEAQQEQFTRAALKRIGEDAPRATPEVLDSAFARIGAQFDDLASRSPVKLDMKLQDDLLNIAVDYQQIARSPAPVVESTVNRISQLSAKNGGILDGEAYKAIRSDLGRLASKADPETKIALRDMQMALDDGIERTISPKLKGEWKEARRQYRDILVIEEAATGAGSDTAMGLISPSQLRQATKTKHGKRNYARGKGDFAGLARAGEAIMKPLPNSGSAARLKSHQTGRLVSAALGGAAGTPGGPGGAALGAALGAIGPDVAGRIAMTKPVQAMLRNQAIRPGTNQREKLMAALVRSILSRQGGESRGGAND